jgi:hypothetical protein
VIEPRIFKASSWLAVLSLAVAFSVAPALAASEQDGA